MNFCGCTQRVTADGSSWGIKHLKWHIGASLPHLMNNRQEQLQALVFQDISRRCGLTFEYTNNPGEANLLYLTGRGRRAQLDGKGNILAYAYLPPTRNFKGQLTCVFDLDEEWKDWTPSTPTRSQGIQFWNVMYHETLHMLGYEHLPGDGYLMSATYAPNIFLPTNHEVDLMVRDYGPPKVTQPTPTPAPSRSTIELMIDGVIRKGTIEWN